MSEKRFYRASVCGDDGLYDKEDGCIIVNVNSNIDLNDNWNTVVDLLNEKQATIKELEEEIKLLKPTNVEQYEQIVQLQEENEQLRKQLDFYLLDEFEWKEKYGDVLDE